MVLLPVPSIAVHLPSLRQLHASFATAIKGFTSDFAGAPLFFLLARVMIPTATLPPLSRACILFIAWGVLFHGVIDLQHRVQGLRTGTQKIRHGRFGVGPPFCGTMNAHP